MPQKKINSFFNSYGSAEQGNMNPVLNFQTNVNPSATRSLHWNTQNYPQTQALQRYHNGRKKQKNLQANEQVLFQNKLMTPNNSQLNQNSQVSEDSQKFPNSSQSQSQENNTWNQRAYRPIGSNPFYSRNKSISSMHLASVGGEYNSIEANLKKEFGPRWQAHTQAEKDQEERDMLCHFLMSAKQCCEEANDIAERVANNMDSFTSEVIRKMKECLETTVPDLLQKIADSNNKKEADFQTKLIQVESEVKKRDEKIATMEQKLLESIENKGDYCTREIVETINQTNQNSQKIIEELIWEIRMNLNKPKPLLCEMASQYSPQLQISTCPRIEQSVEPSKNLETARYAAEGKQRVVQTKKYPAPEVTLPLHSPTPQRKLWARRLKHLSPSPLSTRENTNNRHMYNNSVENTRSSGVALYPRKSLRNSTSSKAPMCEKPNYSPVCHDSNDVWFDQENTHNQTQKPVKRQTRKRKKQSGASKTARSNIQRNIKSGCSGSEVFAPKREDQLKRWSIFDDSDLQDTRDTTIESIDDATILNTGNDDYHLSWLMGRSSDSDGSECAYTFCTTNTDGINLRRK